MWSYDRAQQGSQRSWLSLRKVYPRTHWDKIQHNGFAVNLFSCKPQPLAGLVKPLSTHCMAEPPNQAKITCTMTFALRASLMAPRSLLSDMKPRCLPVLSSHKSGVIYTDALYSPGDQAKKYKPQEAPFTWHPRQIASVDQGWGYVVTVSGLTFYTHGRQERPLTFCRRIYFLELLAPAVLVASFHRALPRSSLPS